MSKNAGSIASEIDYADLDCAIIGGGPAGLSAALNLARLRRRVLVIDDRDGRSLWGQINRNYLGFPNGIAAAQIRLVGRAQAARYGSRFFFGRVGSAASVRAGDRDGFQLILEPCFERSPDAAGREANAARDREHGAALGEECAERPVEVFARCLIIATGVRDLFPRFPGWEQCVGQSLFWCIACDGYKVIDRRVGVVGDDEEAVETALDLLEFSSDVFLVAGSAAGFTVPPERLADLAANGIPAYDCAVARYVNADGQISALVCEDPERTVLPCAAVFAYRAPVARTEVAKMLNVALNDTGYIVVDTEQHTSVPGIYAAGDVTNLHDHQVSAAVHEGNQAAQAANYRLYRPVQRAPGAEAR